MFFINVFVIPMEHMKSECSPSFSLEHPCQTLQNNPKFTPLCKAGRKSNGFCFREELETKEWPETGSIRVLLYHVNTHWRDRAGAAGSDPGGCTARLTVPGKLTCPPICRAWPLRAFQKQSQTSLENTRTLKLLRSSKHLATDLWDDSSLGKKMKHLF